MSSTRPWPGSSTKRSPRSTESAAAPRARRRSRDTTKAGLPFLRRSGRLVPAAARDPLARGNTRATRRRQIPGGDFRFPLPFPRRPGGGASPGWGGGVPPPRAGPPGGGGGGGDAPRGDPWGSRAGGGGGGGGVWGAGGRGGAGAAPPGGGSAVWRSRPALVWMVRTRVGAHHRAERPQAGAMAHWSMSQAVHRRGPRRECLARSGGVGGAEEGAKKRRGGRASPSRGVRRGQRATRGGGARPPGPLAATGRGRLPPRPPEAARYSGRPPLRAPPVTPHYWRGVAAHETTLGMAPTEPDLHRIGGNDQCYGEIGAGQDANTQDGGGAESLQKARVRVQRLPETP